MFEDVLNWIIKEGLQGQSFIKLNSILYPSEELVTNLHNFLIKYFRGREDEIHGGFSNKGNISYALFHCQYQIRNSGSRESQLLEKAAFLMNFYFTSHTFVDGNKRTGFVIAMLFLAVNKLPGSLNMVNYLNHVNFFKKIASRETNDKRNIPEILDWFEKNRKTN